MNYTVPNYYSLTKETMSKKAKVSPEVAQLRRFLSENKVFIGTDSKTGKALIKAEKK